MKHDRQFNIRMTEEEYKLLDKLYVAAMANTDKLITRAAFIREQLVKLCSKLKK